MLALATLGIASLWIGAGLLALWITTRRDRNRLNQPGAAARSHHASYSLEHLEAVSVMKPLCGADPGLSQNLESFFVQDHPSYELVFGVVSPEDPALSVLREVRARHPGVACRVIVHSGGGALNPKVDNLLGMLPKAAHDLVVISDSNIRAPRHYLSELVQVRQATNAGK